MYFSRSGRIFLICITSNSEVSFIQICLFCMQSLYPSKRELFPRFPKNRGLIIQKKRLIDKSKMTKKRETVFTSIFPINQIMHPCFADLFVQNKFVYNKSAALYSFVSQFQEIRFSFSEFLSYNSACRR